MNTIVITQPMLFPWPGFFEQLALADTYIYLDDAQFSKGSFVNRIQVKWDSGTKWMTIPLKGGGSFQTIRVLESTQASWKQSHKALLQQSLRGSPYRDDALDLVSSAYAHDSLRDILIASIEAPARYLGIGQRRKIVTSSELDIASSSSERVLDIVKCFKGTRYISGHGAANYLKHEEFESSSIDVEYMRYICHPWLQAGVFTPFVSILDLIARTGSNAIDHLEPTTTPWREFLASKAPFN